MRVSAKLIGFGSAGYLTGVDTPPGRPDVLPEVDILALQEMLGWLFAVLRQRFPESLRALRQPGSVTSPGAFAAALNAPLDPSGSKGVFVN